MYSSLLLFLPLLLMVINDAINHSATLDGLRNTIGQHLPLHRAPQQAHGMRSGARHRN
jgi:hypothetical protein